MKKKIRGIIFKVRRREEEKLDLVEPSEDKIFLIK